MHGWIRGKTQPLDGSISVLAFCLFGVEANVGVRGGMA